MTPKEKDELFIEFKKKLEEPKEVFVELCRDNISLPEYKNETDAGMDICAAEDVILYPGETKVIPTGIKIAIEEGYEVQVRPRSGLSLKTPLVIPNSPGTIDAGYRDELGIIVKNSSSKSFHNNSKEYNVDEYPIYHLDEKGNKSGIYEIKKGDRIAQLVLNKIEKIIFTQVKENELSQIGNNRGGGFGHTGVN